MALTLKKKWIMMGTLEQTLTEAIFEVAKNTKIKKE